MYDVCNKRLTCILICIINKHFNNKKPNKQKKLRVYESTSNVIHVLNNSNTCTWIFQSKKICHFNFYTRSHKVHLYLSYLFYLFSICIHGNTYCFIVGGKIQFIFSSLDRNNPETTCYFFTKLSEADRKYINFNLHN
jgi:hypothetical protein